MNASSAVPPPPPSPTPAPSGARRWYLLVGLVATLAVAAPVAHFSYVGVLRSRCRAAFEAKDWDQLAALSDRWLAWQPRRVDPLLYRAHAAAEKSDFELAVQLLERLPDVDQRTPEALMQCGAMYFGPLNRPLAGVRVYRRALALNPTLVEAHRRLIYFYAYTLQRRELASQIREAIEWDCDLPETYVYLFFLNSLSFGNAYDQNTEWLKGAPDEERFLVARPIYRTTSRGLLDSPDEQAVQGEQPGDLPYHEQILAEYFQKYPRNLELRCHYLRQASNDGEVERVKSLLADLPAEAEEDARIWRYRGWLHEAEGRLTEADQALRKSLEIDPYDAPTQHQLAGVLRRLQRPGEVAQWETLSLAGKALRKELLSRPDVQRIPTTLLVRMANHIANCGRPDIAEKIMKRVEFIERMSR